jgi:uncharacterized delta-60 repeat protein
MKEGHRFFRESMRSFAMGDLLQSQRPRKQGVSLRLKTVMNFELINLQSISSQLILIICFTLFTNLIAWSNSEMLYSEIETVQTGNVKNDSEASSIAIQMDGKIVAVGSARSGGKSDFAIVRYDSAGSLDSAFGSNGKVITDISANSSDVASSVAIQSDGKLVVAGWTATGDTSFGISNNDFVVVRYNPDGSPDHSFGNGGKVVTKFGADSSEDIAAIALQTDGKIIAIGSTHNGSSFDFAIARYNPNGSLDPAFGEGGKVITAVSRFGDLAHAVAIQPNGKIVVAGETIVNSSSVFAVLRYNSNGSLDASFDSDGMVTTSIGAYGNIAQSVVVLPDGKIVAAGSSFGETVGLATISSSGDRFACVKYNPNGSLDTSFGQGGKAIAVVRPKARAFAMSAALQPDGKIIAAGHLANHNTIATDFVVTRFNANGSLDSSFGQSGIIISKIGTGSQQANSVAIQSGGKIVIGGSTFMNSEMNFVVIKYNENGSIDASFGKDGKVTTRVFK